MGGINGRFRKKGGGGFVILGRRQPSRRFFLLLQLFAGADEAAGAPFFSSSPPSPAASARIAAPLAGSLRAHSSPPRRQPPRAQQPSSPAATAAFPRVHSRHRQPTLPFPAATVAADSRIFPISHLLPLSLVDIVTFQIAAARYYLGYSGHRAEVGFGHRAEVVPAIESLGFTLCISYDYELSVLSGLRAAYRPTSHYVSAYMSLFGSGTTTT
ncbi:uncharacterized protein LOC122007819 [Zingiber officinale]|uniref:uncharacterized protein LOC122007819 n=1 Tax=Zingiber officinale TaxID=94328 RepID=UPI001C4D814F|nr:uncharacterized protein LOC122007819 [Zingiber officinale]